MCALSCDAVKITASSIKSLTASPMLDRVKSIGGRILPEFVKAAILKFDPFRCAMLVRDSRSLGTGRSRAQSQSAAENRRGIRRACRSPGQY